MAKDRGKLIGMYVKEEIAEAVRVRAFEEQCSKAEVLRRALDAYLGPTRTGTGARRKPGGRPRPLPPEPPGGEKAPTGNARSRA